MRAAVFAGAMLVLLAAAMACNATIGNVVVGSSPGCPNGVAPDKAEIYSGEEFYLCGNAYLNGGLLAGGEMAGSEASVMNSTAPIANGWFSLHGTANVAQHSYYYIGLSLRKPCEEGLGEVPVEIRTSCAMLPPSTIEAVPNVVSQGQQFTLRVKNTPRDVSMAISGLKHPIEAMVSKGGDWSQTLPSDECSALGSCIIHFKFVGQKHASCKSSADVVVGVKRPDAPKTEQQLDNGAIALVTLAVIVVGTAGAILLNRYI